jgi:hypothetical protein
MLDAVDKAYKTYNEGGWPSAVFCNLWSEREAERSEDAAQPARTRVALRVRV